MSLRPREPIALPPHGALWLDPATLILLSVTPGKTGEVRAEFALALPNLAELRGTEWFVQSLVIPHSGQPSLGDPANLFVH
jgi:hypothetical protein